ncbi:YwiC-like family protein [Amycolatopsis orientalis]|uniref:YwiC-like family protein n=1 Tax=Amycolatopsis orientalis TaxID=31958 RepID=UPI0003FE2ADB|nr:YwiC-like family protein [Amycolatopsis orientalis]
MSTRTTTRRRSPLAPSQHGAWGFLALPLFLGVAAAGWSPWLAPLALAWVAAYPGGWALTGLLTARRPERFRKAALVWTPLCVLAGAPVLVTHLWLVWCLFGYLLLFCFSLRQARARRERSLTNDLVLIAQCSLVVPIVAGVVAGGGLAPPWPEMTTTPVLAATVFTVLTLVGSTLHVKSLIRERADPRYRRAAQVFAVAAAVTVTAVCVPLGRFWPVAAFVVLACRALWWHDPSWRPARIGMVELAGLILVAASGFLAF